MSSKKAKQMRREEREQVAKLEQPSSKSTVRNWLIGGSLLAAVGIGGYYFNQRLQQPSQKVIVAPEIETLVTDLLGTESQAEGEKLIQQLATVYPHEFAFVFDGKQFKNTTMGIEGENEYGEKTGILLRERHSVYSRTTITSIVGSGELFTFYHTHPKGNKLETYLPFLSDPEQFKRFFPKAKILAQETGMNEEEVRKFAVQWHTASNTCWPPSSTDYAVDAALKNSFAKLGIKHQSIVITPTCKWECKSLSDVPDQEEAYEAIKKRLEDMTEGIVMQAQKKFVTQRSYGKVMEEEWNKINGIYLKHIPLEAKP